MLGSADSTENTAFNADASADSDAPKRLEFLSAAEVTRKAFQRMLIQYGEAAQEKAGAEADNASRSELMEASRICHKLSVKGRGHSARRFSWSGWHMLRLFMRGAMRWPLAAWINIYTPFLKGT